MRVRACVCVCVCVAGGVCCDQPGGTSCCLLQPLGQPGHVEEGQQLCGRGRMQCGTCSSCSVHGNAIALKFMSSACPLCKASPLRFRHHSHTTQPPTLPCLLPPSCSAVAIVLFRSLADFADRPMGWGTLPGKRVEVAACCFHGTCCFVVGGLGNDWVAGWAGLIRGWLLGMAGGGCLHVIFGLLAGWLDGWVL